jgi:hypothetical protein
MRFIRLCHTSKARSLHTLIFRRLAVGSECTAPMGAKQSQEVQSRHTTV